MITDERKEALQWLWNNETNEEDTQEWRDELTEEEARLVAEWDDRFAQGFEQIVARINAKSSLPEQCYVYLPTTNEIGIVKRGEKGYYRTDIPVADPDTNREIVREANQRGGITKAQAAAMEAGSMFGWHTPAADPKNYDENGTPIKPKRKDRDFER